MADTWRWLWPDMMMRIIPMALIPFFYIAILHLPLDFLGLTLHDVPQQVVIGLIVGIGSAAFATTYRMLLVGRWVTWPAVCHFNLLRFFYLVMKAPVEQRF